MADNEPRDVIAELLRSWQGDDAGTYALADQILNKLRAEGLTLAAVKTCPVCAEDIDPFCVRHGWNGQGIASFFREAVTEGYAERDELLVAACCAKLPDRGEDQFGNLYDLWAAIPPIKKAKG